MADSFDKRVTPARPDLAAMHLKGKVDAQRFAEGEPVCIGIGRVSLQGSLESPSEQVSELLYGERFTIYEHGPGWCWGQAASDGYVGYIRGGLLDTFDGPPRHNSRVVALMAPVFATASIKGAVFDFLPLNAVVYDDGGDGDFVQIRPHSYVHRRHLGPLNPAAGDFVAVAERFMGVPYVWGGKTAAGLDCSGLIQTALQAVGKAAPRDTDMQEKALGAPVVGRLQRGDLVFWKGHVGVMRDESHLLHANAHHMMVSAEPLADAVARITAGGNPVTSIRRL